MNKPSVITIRHLNHYYGRDRLKKQILSDINLEIKQREIVILSGPSGAGKTTLLTVIGGLRTVLEGSLKVFENELLNASEAKLIRVRRQIGYVFQAHNLLKSLTARQNVQMSIQLHQNTPRREAKQKSEEALKSVGLGKWLNAYPDNLSGGQKQRVAIARALVSHPKLLLADEPTASLDSKSGREIVNLMQKLVKEKGCTVLMVTHDDRILDIADRILHIEDGKLSNNINLLRSTK
jgi:putative ABC transport system ATP-binding protein